MRTLRSYLIAELLGPFFLGLVVFTFILFIGKMRDLADMVMQAGGGFLRLVPYVPVFSLCYSLPMAVLTATLLGLGRLAADNEIVAMRASGISAFQIMLPAVCLGIGMSLAAQKLNGEIVPRAKHSYEQLLRAVGVRKPELIFRERTLIEDFPGYTIYFSERKGDTLLDVHISEQSPHGYPSTINAHDARISTDESAEQAVLELHQGTITKLEADPTTGTATVFTDYRLTLPLPAAPGIMSKGPREMTAGELRRLIIDYKKRGIKAYIFETEFHQRFALAWASVVFSLVGAPLAIRTRHTGRSGGFGLSLLVIIIYYVLMMLGRSLGERGSLPPPVAAWMPNIVLASAGLGLARRAFRS